MNYFILSADFLSALFLFLILFGIRGQSSRQSKPSFWFTATLWTIIIADLVDGFSYLCEIYKVNDSLLWVLNLFSYILVDIGLPFFVFYIWRVINEKYSCSIRYAHISIVVCSIDLIFVIIGAVTGKLFYVKNGTFNYGPWNWYEGVLQVGLLLVYLLLVLTIRKKIGNKLVLLVSIYALSPIITAVMGIFIDKFSYTYPASSLVMMIAYIIIQSGEVEKRQLKEDMMIELLYTDDLTGLRNRRAFDEMIPKLENGKDITAVFFDLNGLKYTNDTFGHAAGDKLLIRFTEIIKSFYPDETIYRISGDEFTVLLYDVDDDVFNSHYAKLKDVLLENSWIASVGTACGKSEDIADILETAEREMYRNKDEYYEKTGKERRK